MPSSTAQKPTNGRTSAVDSGEYPILLGDSLKDDGILQSKFLRLRYNWQPRTGFADQKATLKRSNGQARLAYRDVKSSSATYDYTVSTSTNISKGVDTSITQLALIFDPDKSAYVLERISHSLDLNLSSAHDQTGDEIRQHRKINLVTTNGVEGASNGVESTIDLDDEDEPDPDNPFDFRHFLSEAKENAEKSSQPAGNRTPIPGSRTPMSGISSPSLGAGRFLSSNTPQFRPTPTSAPLPKKTPATKTNPPAHSKKAAITKRKAPAAKAAPQKPILHEDDSDSSDDDMQKVASVSKPTVIQPKEKGHNRNASSTSNARSPHIVVSDGGLEIDMGSPPPEAKRRLMLDPEMFRSQTHTPTPSLPGARPPPLRSLDDIEMRDPSEEDEDDDRDENDHDPDAEDDVDMYDDDVEHLALDSPRGKKADNRKDDHYEAPSPPTPLPPHPQEEDEDDDFLAAELEKVLNQDGDAPQGDAYDEDESEVSEEE